MATPKATTSNRPMSRKGPGLARKWSESGHRVEMPEQEADQEIGPVAEGQQVHQERRHGEPMRVEVAGPQRHRSLDQMQFVAVVGERKSWDAPQRRSDVANSNTAGSVAADRIPRSSGRFMRFSRLAHPAPPLPSPGEGEKVARFQFQDPVGMMSRGP